MQIRPTFANSVDPDQLASEDNWSGSALFVIQYVNCFINNWDLSNPTSWQLVMGMVS